MLSTPVPPHSLSSFTILPASTLFRTFSSSSTSYWLLPASQPTFQFPFTRPYSGHLLLACTITHLIPTPPHTLPTSMSTFCSLCTSNLKMEVAWSSKTFVSNHHTAQCKNSQTHKFYLHCHENLKSCTLYHDFYSLVHRLHGLFSCILHI